MIARRWLLPTLASASLISTFVVASATSASTNARTITTWHGDTVVKLASLGPHSFEHSGPFPVGDLTVAITVTDANHVTYSTNVELWYPALPEPGAKASYNLGQWVPTALQPLLTRDAATETLVAKATVSELAAMSLPAAHGKFPLVLFSHGYAGVRDQSSYFTTNLASWGFIVAAPDHVTRDFTSIVNGVIGVPPTSSDPNSDIAELLATRALLASNVVPMLIGHVDAARVIAIGHSAGAVSVEELAGAQAAVSTTAPWLKGWLAMAGATVSPGITAPYNTIPSLPGLMMASDNDHVVPFFALKVGYNALGPFRRLVELRGTGHQIFDDGCSVDGGHGAAVVVAQALGSPLSSSAAKQASDGCFSSSGARVNYQARWRVVNQVTVGFVRSTLGIDASTRALSTLATVEPTLVRRDTTAPVT